MIVVRAGFECLLSVLRQDRNLPAEGYGLRQILAIAEEEHISPMVARYLLQRPETAPAAADSLRTVERKAAVGALYWTSELRQLLAAFARADIKAVPLKGPFLGERLYGDSALRVNHDLDILVERQAIAQAENVLAAMGFRPGAPDDYHRPWYRGATTVEVHHDVDNPLAFDFDTAGALGRALPATFHKEPCWKFAPEDELLFLCLHGVRHRFERLSLVQDLALAFKVMRPPLLSHDPELDVGRKGLLVLGLAMARGLDPSLEPLAPLHCSVEQVEHLESLARDLWTDLFTAASEPLDWRALHSFYIEMELPRHRLQRRIRHLRILMGRVIEADLVFAGRFGLRGRSHARLLRPLRLVVNALRG